MKLFTRLVIIIAIVISITDSIVFYHIMKDPERLTIPFVILVIIVTVIPIMINLWYWLKKYHIKN